MEAPTLVIGSPASRSFPRCQVLMLRWHSCQCAAWSCCRHAALKTGKRRNGICVTES